MSFESFLPEVEIERYVVTVTVGAIWKRKMVAEYETDRAAARWGEDLFLPPVGMGCGLPVLTREKLNNLVASGDAIKI